jgi:DNA-binding NtrC family response regulator
MIGQSPALERVRELIGRVAPTDSRVLITGESGTGKELVAAAIHSGSGRRDRPFVRVNCAAIPRDLVESEMFGHEKGAFTGATDRRIGRFELAHTGTLFLDEVGDLGAEAQAKLLRALQDKRIRPIGADRELPVDVRVVAATNQDLRGAMNSGRFRRDLFYLVGVGELTIPPLRDRPDDIRELALRYAKQFATRLGRPRPIPNDEALARLTTHGWPGNVRELINVIERAVLLCTGVTITPADLPTQLGLPHGELSARPAADSELETAREPARPALDVVGAAVELPPAWLEQPWKQVREQLLLAGERAYLIGLLRACGGRIGDCARRAGIAERSLFEKMKRHGLRKEDFRSS